MLLLQRTVVYKHGHDPLPPTNILTDLNMFTKILTVSFTLKGQFVASFCPVLVIPANAYSVSRKLCPPKPHNQCHQGHLQGCSLTGVIFDMYPVIESMKA